MSKLVAWFPSMSLISLVLIAACTALGETARVELRDLEGRAVGDVTLKQTPHGVLMTVEVVGLPPGPHAFHIHQVGDCTPPFESAGGHFNPKHLKHGMEADDGMHPGDLANLHVPDSGKLKVDELVPGVTLEPGPSSLFDADGSSLIIHAGPDDYRTDPSGNAGGRIACGVVKK